ncbi:MAG: hypothetical protein ACRCZF_13560, partial [Gemmataceae bacterium]
TLTVGDKDAISCEFSFDIFRLTKGEENRGVDINVRITSHNCKQVAPTDRSTHKWQWTDKAKETAYLAEKNAIETRLKNGEFGPGAPRSLDSSRPGDAGWKFVNELAQKYGFYEFVSKEVYDYHPDGIPVPVGLFVNSREGVPEVVYGTNYPRVQVFVQCTSPGQMLGMAEGDLYFLEGTQPFWVNYFKSSFGMWCRMTLVIALAVSLSTYLAGVVSLLATALVYLSAYLSEHIRDVASRTNTGGGPFESLTRTLQTNTPTQQLEQTAVTKTAYGLDTVFTWVFRQFNAVIPDIDAFTWTHYLKEGFNVNTEYLLMNALVLFGYILPWMVLSYFLLRNREVAA